MKVSGVEKAVGIEVFFTDTKGIGGRLKTFPEDFIVDEISILKTKPGEFTIARIRARNWETNRLIRQISATLGISRKRIYFAGTKDKRAVTTQLIGFHLPAENVKKMKISDVEILDVYPSDSPLEIGDLIGNRFRITVRNTRLQDDELHATLKKTADNILSSGGFPNFFGIQRFGAVRPITHIVGKHIIHGDFESAVFTYTANPVKGEHKESFDARKFLGETHDFVEALKIYPKQLTFERAMMHYLVKHPEDYVNALRQLPKNLLMMFVHAYQSYIFNKILSERIRRKLPLNEALIGDIILPVDKNNLPDQKNLIMVEKGNQEKINKRIKENKAFVSGAVFGAETKFADSKQGRIERKIVKEEKVKKEDFIIPEMPELSSKGVRRSLLAPLKKIDYDVENNTITLNFELTKGSYATCLLREFMKSAEIMDY
ncbi:MAG: tRNA pseudouridine(13) synthase TruD [Thermoplasmatales archaeon]|nr:tRNA pseudouridine(13) synthase TruD [Thermoplasmatales archaeon]